MMSLLGLIPSAVGRIAAGTARYQATTGEVDLLKHSERKFGRIRGREIGRAFQDPISSLKPVMTVGRQIGETRRRHQGLGKREARARAIEMLARVGIADPSHRVDNYPHEFSGGMRQRVMIAIALAAGPRLMIADEPTTALDVTVQAQIMALVRELQAESDLAVIWVSHDLGVVAGLADRVLVMYGGTIVESAGVEELFENPQPPYTGGLLAAIPGTGLAGTRLASIPGTPPSLQHELRLCPFAERCSHAIDRCAHERPGLTPISPDHAAACFWDIDASRQRDGVAVVARREEK
jgi:peptide/nickel transport system ATP-binding protein/oligopeptide transport system ATP-binding protein